MTEKEKLEQVWGLDQKGLLEQYEKMDEVKKVLWKEVEREDIPSSYESWIESSQRAWRWMSSKFIYWESLKDIIWAILVDYSYYPGWWCGMEYWVKIFVKRWKKSDCEKIVYRDSYSAAYDDWSKAFKSIDSVEVKWDKVIVNVSSSSRKSSYSFYLQKDEEDEELLSKEAQARFQERIEKEKERLLKQKTRENGMMPSSYDLAYIQIPNPQMFNKKYEKAVIMDEATDLWKWECYIVIKTQIDANADGWIQYAWLKYKITPTSTELVAQESAYQSELKEWRRITIRASK